METTISFMLRFLKIHPEMWSLAPGLHASTGGQKAMALNAPPDEEDPGRPFLAGDGASELRISVWCSFSFLVGKKFKMWLRIGWLKSILISDSGRFSVF